MATYTHAPIIHVYREINIGKYKTTRHYELVEVKGGENQLTNKLNLSKDRKCAKSDPTYWLQIRKDNAWVKPRLTGLFKINNKLFHGDTQKKKNLLLFKFDEYKNELTVYYFVDHYTKNFIQLEQYFN